MLELSFGLRDVRVALSRLLVQPLEFIFEPLQLLVGKVLKIDKFIARAFKGPDQLVEFQLNGFPVAVLRVLDDKDHQEGDDSRASIDDELPSVGVVKLRSGCGPHDNHQDRKSEGPCCAQHNRGSAREGTKRVAHYAQKVSLLFVDVSLSNVSAVHNSTLRSRGLWQLRA